MKRQSAIVLALVLSLLTIASASCLPERAEAYTLPPPDSRGSVPASIEEQILVSDAIVLVTLKSVTPDAEFATGERQHEYYWGSSSAFVYPDNEVYYEFYRPMQVLRFLVHDYLKGTGPSEIVVEVRDYDNEHFTSLPDALAFAAKMVTGRDAAWVEPEDVAYPIGYVPTGTAVVRNPTWDDRPGVLFLQKQHQWTSENYVFSVSQPDYSYRLGHLPESESFVFSLSNFEFQEDYLYTIDTLSRAWLPAHPSQDYGEWRFITDGNEDSPLLISLSDLSARIAEIDALVQAGEGIEGYEYCLYEKITHEREMRAEESPWTPFVWQKELDSGLPKGSELYRHDWTSRDQYDRYWVTGSDAPLFENKAVDDDSDSTNGFSEIEATTRPLPMGIYQVNFHTQYGRYISCDFIPSDSYYTAEVTVQAPAGTLHEAFFDPTEADIEDVSPAEFTLRGTSTKIQSLRWDGNNVVMTLNPDVSLSGYALDFIALDGTISLSLLVDEVAADGITGTLSWSMSSRPWANGDQLMLRIREVIP